MVQLSVSYRIWCNPPWKHWCLMTHWDVSFTYKYCWVNSCCAWVFLSLSFVFSDKSFFFLIPSMLTMTQTCRSCWNKYQFYGDQEREGPPYCPIKQYRNYYFFFSIFHFQNRCMSQGRICIGAWYLMISDRLCSFAALCKWKQKSGYDCCSAQNRKLCFFILSFSLHKLVPWWLDGDLNSLIRGNTWSWHSSLAKPFLSGRFSVVFFFFFFIRRAGVERLFYVCIVPPRLSNA